LETLTRIGQFDFKFRADSYSRGRTLAQKLRGIVVKHGIEILSKLSVEDAEKYLEILRKINEVI